MRHTGATLVEITIVFTLVSAVCAVSIPRAATFIDRIAVRGAVTDIESLFSLARHAAISRGAQSVLAIDAAAGMFSIRVAGEMILERDVARGHGVAITSARQSMTYSPIGVGYGAANFSMVVSRGAESDSIIISRLGRVRDQ
jgi:Tfp pilus assembly protein FimT